MFEALRKGRHDSPGFYAALYILGGLASIVFLGAWMVYYPLTGTEMSDLQYRLIVIVQLSLVGMALTFLLVAMRIESPERVSSFWFVGLWALIALLATGAAFNP